MYGNRFFFLFGLAITATACSPGGGGMDAGRDTGGMTGPTVAQLCERNASAQRACMVRQCEIDDAVAGCTRALAHYRPETLPIVDRCVTNMTTCADGGAATMMESDCVTTGINGLAVTTAQRDAVTAVCNACPSFGGSSTATAAECATNFFMAPDAAMPGSSLAQLFRALDDATARTIGTTCAMSAADAGAQCSLSAALCIISTLGISTTSSCPRPDAGALTCLGPAEACQNSSECCGPGLCNANVCASNSCLSAGSTCTRSIECCGTSVCTGGTCTGGTNPDAGPMVDVDGRGGPITLGVTTRGTITTADTYMRPGSTTPNSSDPWTITLAPGMYTIRQCNLGTMDPYLHVFSGTTLLGMDDDSAGTLGSRVIINVTTGGPIVIEAGTFNDRTTASDGNYAVRIDTGANMTAMCPLP